MWAPNWGWIDQKDAAARLASGLQTSLDYIDQHIDMASKMGKPIVLAEFGMNRDHGSLRSCIRRGRARPLLPRDLRTPADSGCAAGDAIAGSNFWAWGGGGRTGNADWMWQPGDPFTGDPPQEAQGLYSLFDSDASTLDIVSLHAKAVHALP